jgi:CBS-domain-containing membrane protein
MSSESAVTEKTDKTQALQLMESLNVDTLPVIDKNRRFVGIVNRSRLTASLIVDVAKELKK